MQDKNRIGSDMDLNIDDLEGVAGGFVIDPDNRTRYVCDNCSYKVLPGSYTVGMQCPLCGGTSFTKKGSEPRKVGG